MPVLGAICPLLSTFGVWAGESGVAERGDDASAAPRRELPLHLRLAHARAPRSLSLSLSFSLSLSLYPGGKVGLLIRKHDHYTPTREIKRYVGRWPATTPKGLQ